MENDFEVVLLNGFLFRDEREDPGDNVVDFRHQLVLLHGDPSLF
jgi:hypothetical protein